MSKNIRRVHTPEFKVQVVLALLKGDKTRLEIASQFGIHPTQLDKWKERVLSELPVVFTHGPVNEAQEKDQLIEELYKQIGQLKVESEWLKKKLGLMSGR